MSASSSVAAANLEVSQQIVRNLDLARLVGDTSLADVVVQAEAMYVEYFERCGFISSLRGWENHGPVNVAFLVVQSKGRVDRDLAGFVVYRRWWPFPRALVLMRVAVAEKYRGRGFGQSLVKLVEEAALQLSPSECTEVVLDALISAVPFYRRLGFAVIPADEPTREEVPDAIWMRSAIAHSREGLEGVEIQALKALDHARLEQDDRLAELVAQAEPLFAESFEGRGLMATVQRWKGGRALVALLAACVEGRTELVGFAVYGRLRPPHRTVYLLNIAVAPRYRRLGYGERLVKLVEEEALSLSHLECTEVTLDADVAVVPFYEKLGYAMQRQQPNLAALGMASMCKRCAYGPEAFAGLDVELLKNLSLRQLEEDEADLIAQAEVEFDDQGMDGGFAEIVDRWGPSCLVALLVVHFWESAQEREVAGFVVYQHRGRSIQLHHVAVTSRYCNLGLGRQLVKLVVDELERQPTATCGEVSALVPLEVLDFFRHLDFVADSSALPQAQQSPVPMLRRAGPPCA